jgi:hypothetical protein
MNETFTPQQQLQFNSIGRYDDSGILDICTTEELVANKEKQEERSSKRILIVDDEPDISFTLKIILEETDLKKLTMIHGQILYHRTKYLPIFFRTIILSYQLPN